MRYMKNIAFKFSNSVNNLVAGLVLQRGFIGSAAQIALHTTAFLSGRQPGQRAWAGIRRATSLL